MRKQRRGGIGPSWSTNGTSITGKGCWRYLYRVRDRDGTFVEVLLSETRDKAAAEAFLRSARTVTGRVPEGVTTDGHDASPGAIKAERGEEVRHRTNRHLNNSLEQDYRGMKHWIRSMYGCKRAEWSRCIGFAGCRTTSGTSWTPAHGGNQWCRSPNGGCSTRPARMFS